MKYKSAPIQQGEFCPGKQGHRGGENSSESVLGNCCGDSVAKKRQIHGEDSLAEEAHNQSPEKSHVSFRMSLPLLCANPHYEAPHELKSGVLCVSSALRLPCCRDMQLPSNTCRAVEVTGYTAAMDEDSMNLTITALFCLCEKEGRRSGRNTKTLPPLGSSGDPRSLQKTQTLSPGDLRKDCDSPVCLMQEFVRFILTLEGEHQLSWTQNSQNLPNGKSQALFLVGPVNPNQRWTLRYYGFHRNNPHLCSNPSDLLELQVSASAQLLLSRKTTSV
ncbi:uncharacterized protein [Castor canadensis]|uniref:Uncharacterized protein n=1 Tax=Castor canadensis TaxID=51338 RepID=A0AC58L8K2_CASCN